MTSMYHDTSDNLNICNTTKAAIEQMGFVLDIVKGEGVFQGRLRHKSKSAHFHTLTFDTLEDVYKHAARVVGVEFGEYPKPSRKPRRKTKQNLAGMGDE